MLAKQKAKDAIRAAAQGTRAALEKVRGAGGGTPTGVRAEAGKLAEAVRKSPAEVKAASKKIETAVAEVTKSVKEGSAQIVAASAAAKKDIAEFVTKGFAPAGIKELMKSAKTTTEMVWGVMPARAGYALVLNAVMVILLMTLMGYARSSSRVHWHVYGVMQDTSEYAFSPALGYAAAIMALNTFLFCMLVAFIFWVASLGGEKKGGATASPAAGHH